jgi:GNAT superfamily N-acetyltransferase
MVHQHPPCPPHVTSILIPPDSPIPWYNILEAKAAMSEFTTSDPTSVGSATAYLLDPIAVENANIDFNHMDVLSHTAGDVFNSPIFTSSDLTGDSFLLIDQVIVTQAYQRKGLATSMIHALHEKARHMLGRDIAVLAGVAPLGNVVLREIAEQGIKFNDSAGIAQVQGRQMDVAMAFWEKLGYIREEGDGRFWRFMVRM